MQICKHLRQECNEQISANQFNPQRIVEKEAHKRQRSNHRLHGSEVLQVRHPIPSRTDRLRAAAIRIKRAHGDGAGV
jgi:hypothetical protein